MCWFIFNNMSQIRIPPNNSNQLLANITSIDIFCRDKHNHFTVPVTYLTAFIVWLKLLGSS